MHSTCVSAARHCRGGGRGGDWGVKRKTARGSDGMSSPLQSSPLCVAGVQSVRRRLSLSVPRCPRLGAATDGGGGRTKRTASGANATVTADVTRVGVNASVRLRLCTSSALLTSASPLLPLLGTAFFFPFLYPMLFCAYESATAAVLCSLLLSSHPLFRCVFSFALLSLLCFVSSNTCAPSRSASPRENRGCARETRISARRHTHTHTHIRTYIYIYERMEPLHGL